MKNYIEKNYPELQEGRQYTYPRLRTIVQEAWDSITPKFLGELIDSMPQRCQAVIDAQGGYTKY